MQGEDEDDDEDNEVMSMPKWPLHTPEQWFKADSARIQLPHDYSEQLRPSEGTIGTSRGSRRCGEVCWTTAYGRSTVRAKGYRYGV